jgi:hypothetical protein
VRSRTVVIVAGLLALTLALAGCGGPSDPMTDADVQAFKGFSTSYRTVATEMLALSTAMSGQRIPAARASLDRLGPELDATDAKVRAVGNRTVRLTLQDYMGITRRAVDATGKLVTHLETAPNQNPSRDLVATIEASNAQLSEADGKLVARILDQAANDRQKAEINRAITISK